MAKNSLNDWSTTVASNTDIAGTNIDVGCPPQDVGTFMRTIMAQVAYAVQGSGGTIPATWNAGQFIGALKGTTTNDNAAAGNVGEFVSSVVSSGSAVSLTNAVETNITSISLTAGDWDVWGTIAFGPNATGIVGCGGSFSTTSGSFAPYEQGGGFLIAASFLTGSTLAFPTGTRRLSLAATTTVYLIGYMNFSGGSATAYGGLFARRAR